MKNRLIWSPVLMVRIQVWFYTKEIKELNDKSSLLNVS
ncbi:hypothetical protein VFMJ11_1065 [Aliivibrio fischeri MJ11]|uniref:Uncharacterized protein n=1 Tax=Aliivibrio fischeri (strain MJ11) TaxID=388396 RepID=B5FD68_ALIFM|nr:hypothetical protein VFMJ11_1065 [Aliivibrio fischeri MJ11]